MWSGEGRALRTLGVFFDFRGEERAGQLKGISCDMWQPYIDILQARAPHAVLVFDKFHIVQHLSGAIGQVRGDDVREKGAQHRTLLAKTRYLWLKNPWDLTEWQRVRLSKLEHLNLKINRAYLLKETFREFWDHGPLVFARLYLDRWFWWATHSRLPPMCDFAWMLRRHQEGS